MREHETTSARVLGQALTFDDVLLRPARAEVLPSEVDHPVNITPRLGHNVPHITAAKDTLTD